MANHVRLNSLEHFLLSIMTHGREPLHVLRADGKRVLKGVSTEDVVKALVELVFRGYANPYFYSGKTGKSDQLKVITVQQLAEHLQDTNETEFGEWPFGKAGEYFFEITEQGRTEEDKREYQGYYQLYAQ